VRETSIPLPEIAEAALKELGLRRVSTDDLTILKVVEGTTVRYIDSRRSKAVNGFHRKRIEALVIPPAWTEVRIARDRQAHLQAIGRDDAGRLQYIYHSSWDDVRSVAKAFRLLELGRALPRLRSRIAADIPPPSPQFPLAAAARLVDLAHLRAGHEAYAGDEGGRGAATLLKRHVKIEGSTISLSFRGKGGKKIEKTLADEPLAAALAELYQWKGPRLFKLKIDGSTRPMTATDLNAYLVKRSGRSISAKDFRTFFASARALERLQGVERPLSGAARKKLLGDIAREIAEELANTPTITRKSYIHPVIIEAFEAGELQERIPARPRRGLSAAEASLSRFLERYTIGGEEAGTHRHGTASPQEALASSERSG
jgi:DNA topoisomerase-1